MSKHTRISFTAKLLPLTLDGTKTATRRLVRKLPKWADPVCTSRIRDGKLTHWDYAAQKHREIPCPYGKAGDWLSCGESIEWVARWHTGPILARPVGDDAPSVEQCNTNVQLARYARDKTLVRAPGGELVEWRWKVNTLSQRYTPNVYRRFWYELLYSGPERLNEITPSACIREGLSRPPAVRDGLKRLDGNGYRAEFAELWDSINIERAPWASDPIVWCLRFRLVSSTGKPEGAP